MNKIKPEFKPGKNIAMKVPAFEFDNTVKFYKDILGYEIIKEEPTSVSFNYGGKTLWVDKVETISQSEIWLEIVAEDIKAVSEYFEEQGISRCDYIEKLPDGFNGFWIAAPGNVIHLVSEK
jgi:catechol 2,3-dioxygenase-like lactoylglutathione lyase family enzyme